MGETFRQRLASDPYFTIRVKEPEKLCPFSDKLLELENPDSVDYDSQIKMMNTDEWRQHVRKCQELQIHAEQYKNEQKKRLSVRNS